MGSQQLIRVMGSIRTILDGRRHEEGSLRLGQVVFAAPDVSAAVFNVKILQWAKLAQRVTIYTSGGDWVLWLSSFLRGLNDRAGGHTPWGEPLYVNASNVYVVDKTPPEYDYWKFFKYTHADYVDDKVILNDIQTVITGKPAGDPSQARSRGQGVQGDVLHGASRAKRTGRRCPRGRWPRPRKRSKRTDLKRTARRRNTRRCPDDAGAGCAADGPAAVITTLRPTGTSLLEHGCARHARCSGRRRPRGRRR